MLAQKSSVFKNLRSLRHWEFITWNYFCGKEKWDYVILDCRDGCTKADSGGTFYTFILDDKNSRDHVYFKSLQWNSPCNEILWNFYGIWPNYPKNMKFRIVCKNYEKHCFLLKIKTSEYRNCMKQNFPKTKYYFIHALYKMCIDN